MNLSDLVVHHEISDEAAAHLSELLNDLAFAFDGQYCAQIRRYYDERRENERPCHHSREIRYETTWDTTYPGSLP